MATTARPDPAGAEELDHERSELLSRLERGLERPMLVLGLVWVVLLVLELTRGLSPLGARLLDVIWVAFVAEFLLRLALAPRRLAYLRANWLVAVSLALPALRLARGVRLLRALRSARAARGLRLVRIVSATNRGTRALGRTMHRRGLKYVLAATVLVTLAGAAGLLALEGPAPGFESFGEALWFTAMLMTTIASERWPQTVEGRVLCLLLSLYAMGVLGYITAALASHFVGRDAEAAHRDDEGPELRHLRDELSALRAEVRAALPRPGS